MTADALLPRNSEVAQPENASASSSAAKKFGKSLRSDFLFDDDYLNLNHGNP